MSARTPCAVPFCRRTTKAEEGVNEWVCGAHWRGVPRRLRARYNLAKRRARRILRSRPGHSEYWKYPPGSPARLRAVAMWRRVEQVWCQCRDAAIEAAAGIT